MSTHYIQFYDKVIKNPFIFVFLSYRNNFVGTQKRVRISHGKQAIGVRATEVRVCVICGCCTSRRATSSCLHKMLTVVAFRVS